MKSHVGKFKVMFCGDGVTGKTYLIKTIVNNKYPESTEPFVHYCEPIEKNIQLNGVEYNLTLWDSPGQEDYDRLRPLFYPDTNCYILCYSISYRYSFTNIFEKWTPEIRQFSPSVPIVLIGTKKDERIDKSNKFITTEEGLQLKEQIKADYFVECSAKNMENLNEVLYAAIRSIENKENQDDENQEKCCFIC